MLSAFGLLPTASDLLSAAPLPGLVRTVADLVPEVHVDVGVSPAVEAVPLPALASPRDVLDGGLFKEDNALPTSGAPAGFGIAAASSPKATVVLDVAGISVGLQIDTGGSNVPTIGPQATVDVSVGANDQTAAEETSTGPSPNGQSVVVAPAHVGADGKQVSVAPAASSPTGLGVALPTGVFVVPVTGAVVPAALPHAVVAEPGPAVGQPAGSQQNAVVGQNELFPAGTGESPLPDAPDVRDRDIARINRESFSPQASGLLTDVIPIDVSAMENALQQFLDQLDDLGQDVGGWLRTAGPMPWVVLSLGIAAATAEIARRRLQQAHAKVVQRKLSGAMLCNGFRHSSTRRRSHEYGNSRSSARGPVQRRRGVCGARISRV